MYYMGNQKELDTTEQLSLSEHCLAFTDVR